MRGCLSVLVLGAAFVAGLVWLAGPPIASGLVTLSLQASGLTADRLDVTVTAVPPLELAIGRADRLAIRATGARWRGVRFASLDVELGSVDLVGRTARTADGRLDGVELDTAGGRAVVADVTLHGDAAAASTTIRIDGQMVDAVAIDAFDAQFGVRPSTAGLVAPDRIRVILGGHTVDGRLAIGAGSSVVAVAQGETIVLFTPSPALALHLSSVAVTRSGLELRGTLDVGALLR